MLTLATAIMIVFMSRSASHDIKSINVPENLKFFRHTQSDLAQLSKDEAGTDIGYDAKPLTTKYTAPSK